MSIADNLKRGTVELMLLTLIADEEMYGYQLAQELEKRSSGKFTLQEGSLYPTMYRLEKRGYISSRTVTPEGSRRFRVYYKLTPAGADYLAEVRREYINLNSGIMQVLGITSLDQE
ncbi:MAG: helix-turn-helix transcriptional regulator [Clostridia bacterium]|nr:helix-turn-helix transcriptional regulator [Clostridia bacterium]